MTAETETDDETEVSQRRGRWIVIALWCLVCGWLVFSLLAGVVGSLFFGEGPATVATGKDTPTAVQGVVSSSTGR
jgi:membrane protein YqaA with SNARE-associated domain